ncbi:hypothetical protein [Arthrobacter rhombi]|uniref:hypothetical protein n=1 Tax=Arthrobacter rhombi TaxID=71253 RepID=UPI003FD60BC7
MSKQPIGGEAWTAANPGRRAIRCTIDGTFVLITRPGYGYEFDTIAEAVDEAHARIAATTEPTC